MRALATLATGTDAFIVAGLLPALAHSLGTSVAVAGQVVTLFAFAYAVGSPLITAATANWPRRVVLTGGLLCFALVNAGSAVSPSIGVLAVTRVLAALLAGLLAPTAYASAVALVGPSMRGRALAIVLGGTALSTVLGVPIGLTVGGLAGWRGGFVFVAVLAVAAAIAVAALLPGLQRSPRLALRARVTLLGRPEIVSVLAITVCANAGAFSVYTYVGPLFGGLGGDGALRALIFTFGAAGVVGGYLGGRSADRWGPVTVLVVILAVFTVNHILLAVWQHALATSLLYVAVWGIVGWGTTPPLQHRLVGAAGAVAPVALSLNASALYLGIGLGGLLGGLAVHNAGADALWLPAGAGGALALLLLPVSAAAERRAAAGRLAGAVR